MDKFIGALQFLEDIFANAAWFPTFLVLVGVWFTIYLGVPQIRYFARGWRVLFKGGKENRDRPGDTTNFQAMSTALSGTVGTGNIGGVALALALGGPAALFWMWVTAAVGMTTKFVEVTLSHKYRETDKEGKVVGGPMYFLEKQLGVKWLAIFFCIATLLSCLGSGNLPQSNSVASGIEASFGIPPWVTGAALAVLLALVIVGGIKRIAKVTSAVVPVMGVLYLLGAMAVLFHNYENVIPSFFMIFESAFNGSAAVGGFLGAGFAYAATLGIKRGLFSNEAGQGSAPIAHSSARGDEPVSEGHVSILEPFIDTLVICTITGLVILSSGVWTEKHENEFHYADIEIIEGIYNDDRSEDVAALAEFHGTVGDSKASPITRLNAQVEVVNGRLVQTNYTILHKKSIAEDVRVMLDGRPYNGMVWIRDGKPKYNNSGTSMHGRSLLDSVPLTAEAFKRSVLGEHGQYAVTLTLVLFAFSTAIAWSYYGDRAVVYLVGTNYLFPYRLAYAFVFFIATVLDTSIVWMISGITLVFMALPNLIGITLLSRDMKRTIRDHDERAKSASE